mgnify:FL=1
MMPVPKKPTGFSYGTSGAFLKLEAYYDLQCVYSAKSFANLLDAIEKEKLFGNEHFHFRIHLFPLPYHKEAFMLTMGAHAVSEIMGNEAALEYIAFTFANRKAFGTKALYDLTMKDVFHCLIIDSYEAYNFYKRKFQRF